jgi:hypothetical protein
MQATVHTFAPDGSGSVLLDDGRELPFAAAAFAESGLRLLRPGQRLTVLTGTVGVDGSDDDGATESVERGEQVVSLRIKGIGPGERIG